MDFGIRLGEVLKHLTLVLVVVLVADADEVESSLCKLLNEVGAVGYARAKHDSLLGTAKHFIGLGDPLGHHITGNLDAAFCGFLV